MLPIRVYGTTPNPISESRRSALLHTVFAGFFSEIAIRLTWTRKPVKMHFYGLSVCRWSVSFYGQCYVQGFFFFFFFHLLCEILWR